MKWLTTFLLLCVVGISAAQKSPSAVLKSLIKANDEERWEDVKQMLWAQADQEDIIKTLQTIKEKYGAVNYFIQTDSVYRTSRTAPKKYYEFKYNTYYQNSLFRYTFTVVEEKGNYRLVSFIYNAHKGNYDDPLVNTGVLMVSKLFVNNIVAGKTKDAYSLFAKSLTESLPEQDFRGMADIINNTLGELKSIEYIDTCTALNLYGDNESIGLFSMKLLGSKDNLYFNGTVAMTNDGTFFITRFQLFETIQLNNITEMKAAEGLIDEFYYAWSVGAYDKLYALIHPELQEVKSLESITELLESVKNAVGKHVSHIPVSQIFARNKANSDLNKFMLVVRDENQNKLLHDNFVLLYDKEGNLKISYFYLVEY